MDGRNWKEMPACMKRQRQENKKDRYMEITETLLAVAWNELEAEERAEYLEALLDTLDEMDMQIYECYRALADRFAVLCREAAANAEIDAGRLEQLAERGVRKDLLLPEQMPGRGGDSGFDAEGYEESIDIDVRAVLARSATLELVGAGCYDTETDCELYIDGAKRGKIETVVFSVYDLIPDSDVEILVVDHRAKCCGRLRVHTGRESVTLDVTKMGARGDGEADDTAFIQAAILACPNEGRVLIPAGTYRITCLFLKSGVRIELQEHATLLAIPDRSRYPVLPGSVPAQDGEGEYLLGTWEGNPLPMYAGIITGIGVEDAVVYGRGTIDGNASVKDWWENPKQMRDAYRPRLVFLNACSNITLQGLTLKNSPAWTIHPFFSERLRFYNVEVNNPFDSPNTDGLDPESCSDVEIAGMKFSLGDDCIAVKSGKIYMGRTYRRPSENIRVRHCLMENGHGAVTIGSEMAGGVRSLLVEDCVFSHTDRGLRVKTRRGRGKDAILDEIVFRRIRMEHVMTPFVVNSFYFCDPDGRTEYVQSRKAYPTDERTPEIRRLVFEDITAANCHVMAAFFEGLPEKKIEEIVMRRICVSYAEHPNKGVPAMSEGVEACEKKGIFAKNIKKMTLDEVNIAGAVGEAVVLEDVEEVIEKNADRDPLT